MKHRGIGALVLAICMLTFFVPASAQDSKLATVEQVLVSMPKIDVVFRETDPLTPSNITEADVSELSAQLGGELISITGLEDAKNIPAKYFFLVDTSGSISKPVFDEIRKALIKWKQALAPDDTMALITFGEDVSIALDGGETQAEAENVINMLKANEKTTHLFDGLSMAVNTAGATRDTSGAREIILLFTDGRDFSEPGSTTQNEISELLNNAGIPLYALGIGNSKESLNSLGKLARDSGGAYIGIDKETSAQAMLDVRKYIESARVMHLSANTNVYDGSVRELTISLLGRPFIQTRAKLNNSIPDVEAPRVLSVKQSDAAAIEVVFSEDVTGADNTANYILQCGGKPVAITGASYDGVTHTAVLTLQNKIKNAEYSLRLIHIRDVSMEKNQIDSDATAAEAVQLLDSVLNKPKISIWLIALGSVIIIAIVAIVILKKKKNRQENNPEATPASPSYHANKPEYIAVDNEERVSAQLIVVDRVGSQSAVSAYIGRSYIIGRSSSQTAGIDLIIKDEYIARRQCRLFSKEHRLFIEDLGSTNGTNLNGVNIGGQPHLLENGDAISIGSTKIIIRY